MTHKKLAINLPENYRPMMLGAIHKDVPEQYLRDDSGTNISLKNDSYCELTGLYEIWKNSTEKYVGLAHYRRFFLERNYHSRFFLYCHLFMNNHMRLKPIPEIELKNYMKKYDWVVSTQEIEFGKNLWEHWGKYHQIRDIEITADVIRELYPEYLNSFYHVLKKNNKMSPFNMFYTSKDQLNEYSHWLFSILGTVEDRVDISEYDTYHRRLFGFLGEKLFNVWLYQHGELKIKYLTVYNTHLSNRRDILRRFKDRGRIK